MVVRFKPSKAEREADAFDDETLNKALHCLRADGVVILEDVVNPRLVRQAKEAFFKKYSSYLDGRPHSDALDVSAMSEDSQKVWRAMITVDIDPPFDETELLANSWILSVLRTAFDDDVVLGAYGVVCSLPGAPRQHVHIDGGDLFPQAGLNRLLPVFAATVAIPLIEMNEEHGTTALWPGSHRDEQLAAAAEQGKGPQEPNLREGSSMLWDYRLLHGGTENRSAVPRPLLYMTYCRSWFLDHKNYKKQAPVRVPAGFSSKLPQELRQLLVRAERSPAFEKQNAG